MHQGSALNPFFSIMTQEALSQEFRSGLPWEILYAHNLVLAVEILEEVKDKF